MHALKDPVGDSGQRTLDPKASFEPSVLALPRGQAQVDGFRRAYRKERIREYDWAPRFPRFNFSFSIFFVSLAFSDRIFSSVVGVK